MFKAITYIGYDRKKVVKIKNRVYEFEWQKSVGIGSRFDEVEYDHAIKMSKWCDKKGRKVFKLE